jgi:hypothetical protein
VRVFASFQPAPCKLFSDRLQSKEEGIFFIDSDSLLVLLLNVVEDVEEASQHNINNSYSQFFSELHFVTFHSK